MRKQRYSRRGVGALAALALLGVTGCVPEGVPMISEPRRFTSMTFVEQLLWVESQLNEGIAAVGITEGWFVPFGADRVDWDGAPENRLTVLGSMIPKACGTGGRLNESALLLDAPDPLGAALRIRAAWEAEGWVVTDLYGPPTPEFTVFRADREDGAMMGFDGNPDGLILKAYAPCSVHSSLSSWHVDVEERDAFLDSIEAEIEP
ncbi:hypothetical protein ACFSWE_12915 [Leucobacter albus]|uniref:Lipoprotein n=1 Tax=Leucobacter albus TaxID=272210 RepID=A0ABW3TP70_9MICO